MKPIDLMRWLVRLVTPPGGTVLDPFAGSGTTGIAAVLEGFDFVGIEREEDYCAIARARIEWWSQHQGKSTDEILEKAGFSEKLRRSYEEAGQMGLLDDAPVAARESRSVYGFASTKTVPRCAEHDAALPSGSNSYSCGCAIQYAENGRDGEATAEKRYTDSGSSNFAMKPGRRRKD